MPIIMIAGFSISLILVLVLMPSFINFLKKLSFRQTVSEYALDDDKKKAGTPIMGGILFIVIPVLVSAIATIRSFNDLSIWIVMLAFVGYGLIGFVDDYLIAVKKNNDGLSPKQKFGLQLVLAVLFFFLYRSHADLSIALPFVSHPVNLGWGYFILILLMFTGSSNAVNLTDGMDGLAAGCSIIALCAFLVVALVQHRIGLSVLICSLLGSLCGYLYYNKKPARVFMGDTGSLALGGIMAAMAMTMKIEVAFIVIAGIFVMDTLSVIIQITSVKTRHKKVFVYTPIHFAFRIKGMPENSVVHMFWLIEACFATLGLFIALH